MRYFTTLFLLLLAVSFTSCFEELQEDVIITSPEVDTPENEPVDANFSSFMGGWQMENAYLVTLPSADDNTDIHHLIITQEAVANNNLELRGASPAFTLTIASPRGELAGTYRAGGDFGAPLTTTPLRVYNRLQFSDNRVWSQGVYENEGELVITATAEGKYRLSFNYQDSGFLGGDLTGELEVVPQVIPLPGGTTPDAAEFQGPNIFSRGDESVSLQHAYLVRDGNSGQVERFILYLTENELEVADDLRGVSTTLMLKTNGNIISTSGSYGTLPTGSSDYLSTLLPGISRSLYCTNLNFRSGSFDTDEETIGETLVRIEGDEVMIRFEGGLRGTNIPVSGLYRGPVTVLD